MKESKEMPAKASIIGVTADMISGQASEAVQSQPASWQTNLKGEVIT